jgi:DMSO/TMAO reductase YedYZ molybdopterin-dependent catalytic subunit
MSRKVFFIVALVLLLGLAACGGAAPKQDWVLRVGGAVSSPLSLSYAELAKMPQSDLKDILMQRSLGEDTVGDWSGVALEEILKQAGAPADYASITAVAADGYAIEIPRDEIQDAIVALKEDGKWIAAADPDHGPIRLVAPYTPANRWVFQLQELQVNGPGQAASGIPENAALKITGNVETELGWTEEKIRSMDTMEAQSTNKAGETETHIGVAINDLLGKAGPKPDATALVLVADDGYTAEVSLAEVQSCGACIVAFRSEGGFGTVLPGFPGNVQVKGVVEIQVK